MLWLKKYVDVAGEPGRYPALDGIRALAILLVLGRHAAVSIQPELVSQPDNWLWYLLRNGWAGVDLFFVLSGFLISLHLRRWFEQDRSKIWPRRYLLKRVLRTFPLYYAIILLVYAGWLPGYDAGIDRPWYELGVHLLFLQDYLGSNLLVPLWSLATEEKFYLLAPLLLYALVHISNGYSRMLMLLMLLLASVTLRSLAFDQVQPDNYTGFFWSVRAPFHQALDGLLLGIVVQELFSSHVLEAHSKKFANHIFAACFILIVVILGWVDWTAAVQLQSSVIIILLLSVMFAGLIWAGLFVDGWIGSLLGSAPLRFVAKLSYSMYLTHYALIDFSRQQSGMALAAGVQSIILFTFIYLALTLGVSLLLHYLVEKPFLILKGRL